MFQRENIIILDDSHLKSRIKHLNINPTCELCPRQADLFHNCLFPWKRNWRSQACGELQSFSRCEVLKTNTSSCGCRVYVGHATWDRKRYLAHCHICVDASPGSLYPEVYGIYCPAPVLPCGKFVETKRQASFQLEDLP